MRFVFVHGGFHAAWCWDRTIAELLVHATTTTPTGPLVPH
jgi:hypothetical protein